jgi:adhesin transport system outer membrane protein
MPLPHFALVLALSLIPISAAGQTLRDAVARAVSRFPDIEGAAAQRDVLAAQTGQARAELYPALRASVSEGKERSNNVSTRSLPGDPVLRRREAQLTLSQLLFDGGEALEQIKRTQALTEAAKSSLSEIAQDVALRASQAFLDVRQYRDQLENARRNIATHERTLADVRTLAEAGRGRGADVVQAQARLALAASSIEQISGQLSRAEATYIYLTGTPPGALAPPPSFATDLPRRLDDALDNALAQHPSIRVAQKQADAATHDRESARARLVSPRLSLELGVARNRGLDGIPGANDDRFAMLRLRYNLFRGFGDEYRVQEAQARIHQSIADIEQARLALQREIRESWDALASERSRLLRLEQYAQASAVVVENYRGQFQLGQRSLLDVLNAENERFNAQASLITARFQVASLELRLLAGLGTLLDVLDVRSIAHRAEVSR